MNNRRYLLDVGVDDAVSYCPPVGESTIDNVPVDVSAGLSVWDHVMNEMIKRKKERGEYLICDVKRQHDIKSEDHLPMKSWKTDESGSKISFSFESNSLDSMSQVSQNIYREHNVFTVDSTDLKGLTHKVIDRILGGTSDQKLFWEEVFDLKGPVLLQGQNVAVLSPDYHFTNGNEHYFMELKTSRHNGFMSYEKYYRYYRPIALCAMNSPKEIENVTFDVIQISPDRLYCPVIFPTSVVEQLCLLVRSCHVAIDRASHDFNIAVKREEDGVPDLEYDNIRKSLSDLFNSKSDVESYMDDKFVRGRAWITKKKFKVMQRIKRNGISGIKKILRDNYHSEIVKENEKIMNRLRIGISKATLKENIHAKKIINNYWKNEVYRSEVSNRKQQSSSKYSTLFKFPLFEILEQKTIDFEKKPLDPDYVYDDVPIVNLWRSVIKSAPYKTYPDNIHNESSNIGNRIYNELLNDNEQISVRKCRKESSYISSHESLSNHDEMMLGAKGLNFTDVNKESMGACSTLQNMSRNKVIHPDTPTNCVDESLDLMTSLIRDSFSESNSFFAIEELLSESLKSHNVQLSENYQLETNSYNSALGQWFETISDCATELCTSIKTSLKRNEMMIRYIPNKPVAIISKMSSFDKSCVYSYCFDKEFIDLKSKTRIFSELHDVGNYYVTKLYSASKDKLDNWIKAHSNFICLISFFKNLHRVNPLSHDLSELPDVVKKQTCLTMMMSFDDKKRTEEIFTLARYVCMDKFTHPYLGINKAKLVPKLPQIFRSILELWATKKLTDTMLQERYSLTRNETLMNDGKKKKEMPNYKNLIHPFLQVPLENTEQLVNSWYIGYAKNKDEDDKSNTYMKLLEKIIKSELELYKTDPQTMLCKTNNMDVHQYTGHSSELNHIALAGMMFKETMKRRYGENFESILFDRILDALASINWTDVATCQATSVFNDTEKIEQNKLGEYVVKGQRLIEGIFTLLEDIKEYKPALALTKLVEEMCENENSDLNKVLVHIFGKKQHGGVREIFVMSTKLRVLQLCIETIFKTCNTFFKFETLTHPENKMIIPKSHLYNAISNKNKESIFVSESSDKTKWSQNLSVDKLFALSYYALPPGLHGFLACTLRIWNNKKVRYPMDFLNTMFNHRNDTEDMFEDPLWQDIANCYQGRPPKTYFDLPNIVKPGVDFMQVSSGFMQGVLHFTSSFYHACMINMRDELFKEITRERAYNDFDFLSYNLVSSDDSSRGYVIRCEKIVSENQTKKNESHLVYALSEMMASKYLNSRCGMTDSIKSTYGTINFMEFNSNWFHGLSVINPSIKFVLSSTKMVESDSFYERQESMSNLLSQVTENGAPFSVSKAVQFSQALIHYRIMGINTSLVSGVFREKLLEVPTPMFGLFMMDDPHCAGACGLQYNHYKHLQSHPNLSRLYKKSLSVGDMYMTSTGNVASPICLNTNFRKKASDVVDRADALYPGWQLKVEESPELLYRQERNLEEAILNLLIKLTTKGIEDVFSKGKGVVNLLGYTAYALTSNCISTKPTYYENCEKYINALRAAEMEEGITLKELVVRMSNPTVENNIYELKEMFERIKDRVRKNSVHKTKTNMFKLMRDTYTDWHNKELPCLDPSDVELLFPYSDSYLALSDSIEKVRDLLYNRPFVQIKFERKVKCKFILHEPKNIMAIPIYTLVKDKWFGIRNRFSHVQNEMYYSYYKENYYSFLKESENKTFIASSFPTHRQMRDFFALSTAKGRMCTISGAPVNESLGKNMLIRLMFCNQNSGFEQSDDREKDSYFTNDEKTRTFLHKLYMLASLPFSKKFKDSMFERILQKSDFDCQWDKRHISSISTRGKIISVLAMARNTLENNEDATLDEKLTISDLETCVRVIRLEEFGFFRDEPLYFSKNTTKYLKKHCNNERDPQMKLTGAPKPYKETQNQSFITWTGILFKCRIRIIWYKNVVVKIEIVDAGLFQESIRSITKFLLDVGTKYVFDHEFNISETRIRPCYRFLFTKENNFLSKECGVPVYVTSNIDSAFPADFKISYKMFEVVDNSVCLTIDDGRRGRRQILKMTLDSRDYNPSLGEKKQLFRLSEKQFTKEGYLELCVRMLNNEHVMYNDMENLLKQINQDSKSTVPTLLDDFFEKSQLIDFIYSKFLVLANVTNPLARLIEKREIERELYSDSEDIDVSSDINLEKLYLQDPKLQKDYVQRTIERAFELIDNTNQNYAETDFDVDEDFLDQDIQEMKTKLCHEAMELCKEMYSNLDNEDITKVYDGRDLTNSLTVRNRNRTFENFFKNLKECSGTLDRIRCLTYSTEDLKSDYFYLVQLFKKHLMHVEAKPHREMSGQVTCDTIGSFQDMVSKDPTGEIALIRFTYKGDEVLSWADIARKAGLDASIVSRETKWGTEYTHLKATPGLKDFYKRTLGEIQDNLKKVCEYLNKAKDKEEEKHYRDRQVEEFDKLMAEMKKNYIPMYIPFCTLGDWNVWKSDDDDTDKTYKTEYPTFDLTDDESVYFSKPKKELEILQTVHRAKGFRIRPFIESECKKMRMSSTVEAPDYTSLKDFPPDYNWVDDEIRFDDLQQASTSEPKSEVLDRHKVFSVTHGHEASADNNAEDGWVQPGRKQVITHIKTSTKDKILEEQLKYEKRTKLNYHFDSV
uniref:RNA-directed RNA polymerase L n=1 Tax=Caenorhabditis brenneri bunyavirus TaxID=1667232 RepID=A0A0M3WMT2_9VIRU|nr:RNA-dependent RNA polymerase [Caenorhabditis brenneri bunyavirus]